MSGVDAAGEIIGGGLAGRAVEHELSSDEKGRGDRPSNCLNCGTPLVDDFCHHCGQKAHIHRTLGGLLHDIVHGVLHLDGKFWNTLPKLVWKPGQLTRDYIEGKRARYISPIAFYLFTVVAMFALVVSIGDFDNADIKFTADASDIETIEEAETALADLDADIAELEAQDFPGAAGAIVGITAQRDATRERLVELGGTVSEDSEAGASSDEGNVRMSGPLKKDYEGKWYEGLATGFERATGNPALFLYKVQTTSYKLSWLLIPLSLPFMWLLFPFSKRYRMYDHAVFVTYSISFMMLMVVVVGLVAKIVEPDIAIVMALIYAPVHIYRHIKGTYELGRLSAVLRTAALSIITWTVLGIFLGLMFALGAI
ncbi:MAG: DUF3667 domain-containing protein [Sphingomonas sp.]|nr:DUF3667 domain-containing protein [Sphingomonas sp.]